MRHIVTVRRFTAVSRSLSGVFGNRPPPQGLPRAAIPYREASPPLRLMRQRDEFFAAAGAASASVLFSTAVSSPTPLIGDAASRTADTGSTAGFDSASSLCFEAK
jgi:hypothetical protein